MNSTFSTRGIAIAISVLALISIAGYYFLFQEIRERTMRTSDMQNQVDAASGKEEYLLSLKTVLGDVKGDLKILDGRVIPKDGTVAFLDRLESVGRFAGVKMTTDALGVGAAGGESDGFLEQVGLSISAEGSYSSLRYFLSLLEVLPYSITIPAVSLERGGDKSESKNLWRGSFKITALIHK